MSVAVEAKHLVKHYRGNRKRIVHALNDVSFSIEPGTTLGIVGESGAGKSTVGRSLLRLTDLNSGQILMDGTDIARISRDEFRGWRARVQVVFQDPYGSLDPRMQIGDLVEEPLHLHTDMSGVQRRARVRELLELVHLDSSLTSRLPSQLSGGQLQRVGIARAIATHPAFVVLDEPTASLDLSVRAEVLALLADLQIRLRLTYLLISHDLFTIATFCHQVAVMYLGKIVEIGPARQVFDDPQHPYTQALLSASLPADPNVRRNRVILQGEMPSPFDLPSGCFFASRCPLVRDDCTRGHPAARSVSIEHSAACVRIDDGTNKLRSVGYVPWQSGSARGSSARSNDAEDPPPRPLETT